MSELPPPRRSPLFPNSAFPPLAQLMGSSSSPVSPEEAPASIPPTTISQYIPYAPLPAHDHNTLPSQPQPAVAPQRRSSSIHPEEPLSQFASSSSSSWTPSQSLTAICFPLAHPQMSTLGSPPPPPSQAHPTPFLPVEGPAPSRSHVPTHPLFCPQTPMPDPRSRVAPPPTPLSSLHSHLAASRGAAGAGATSPLLSSDGRASTSLRSSQSSSQQAYGQDSLDINLATRVDSIGAEDDVDSVRYKTMLCPQFRSPTGCPRGSACEWAHGANELRSVTVNLAAIRSVALLAEQMCQRLGYNPFAPKDPSRNKGTVPSQMTKAKPPPK